VQRRHLAHRLERRRLDRASARSSPASEHLTACRPQAQLHSSAAPPPFLRVASPADSRRKCVRKSALPRRSGWDPSQGHHALTDQGPDDAAWEVAERSAKAALPGLSARRRPWPRHTLAAAVAALSHPLILPRKSRDIRPAHARCDPKASISGRSHSSRIVGIT
jgi:hypothetical protein